MSDQEVVKLLEKHYQRGLVVDTNILLVYFVGLCDPGAVEKFKRTQTFTREDFELIRLLLSKFSRIISTPGILAEVSNLSDGLKNLKPSFFSVFRAQVDLLDERLVPSKEVCGHAYFAKCGLTDAAILQIAADGLLVLTNDFALTGYLGKMGIDWINFNHIRTFE